MLGVFYENSLYKSNKTALDKSVDAIIKEYGRQEAEKIARRILFKLGKNLKTEAINVSSATSRCT